jgi:hypothetical protein
MKTKTVLLAVLLPCIFVTLPLNAQSSPYYSGHPVPVLPIGGDQLDQGTVYGNVYSVYDKAGKNYSGVVVGDSDYSITYPIGKGDPVMKSGNTVISLGR